MKKSDEKEGVREFLSKYNGMDETQPKEKEKEVNGMGRKVIPFQKPNSTSTITETIDQELIHQKASGETTRTQLADYLKQEAERVRTVALLLEVAETICREEESDGNKPDSP